MKALIDADHTHADVTGVPAQLLVTTSGLGSGLRDHFGAIHLPLLATHGTADLMADPDGRPRLRQSSVEGAEGWPTTATGAVQHL